MVGYPKYLNSKADYLYVKDNFDKAYWEKDFQALLDTQEDWFFDKDLDSKEDGIEDDTHKIVENTIGTGDDAVTTYAQYVYQTNPHCKLLKLGFTANEIKKYLAS